MFARERYCREHAADSAPQRDRMFAALSLGREHTADSRTMVTGQTSGPSRNCLSGAGPLCRVSAKLTGGRDAKPKSPVSSETNHCIVDVLANDSIKEDDGGPHGNRR